MSFTHRHICRAEVSDISKIIASDHLSQDPKRQDMINYAVIHHETYIVCEDMEVIAYGILEYSFFGNGFISMIYVNERYRRQRVGEELLLYLIQLCSTPKVFSSTNLSNFQMQQLLRKLGFKDSGIVYNLDEGDPEMIFVRLPI